MMRTPATYQEAQVVYQAMFERCRGLPDDHPMREALAACEELRDKLWLTRPITESERHALARLKPAAL